MRTYGSIKPLCIMLIVLKFVMNYTPEAIERPKDLTVCAHVCICNGSRNFCETKLD